MISTTTRMPPVPKTLPRIDIVPLRGKPFAIKSPELLWWHIVPQPSEHAITTRYTPPDWDLSDVHEMEVVGGGKVHGGGQWGGQWGQSLKSE